MASEISASFQVTVQNGGLLDSKQYSFQADQATARVSKAVQNIPTTAGGTQLVLNASLATQGLAYFINLDPTNFVTIGVKPAGTFYPLIRLKGATTVGKREGALLRLEPGVAVWALADTGAVDLEFSILHN